MHVLKMTAAAALCALPLVGNAQAFGPVAVPFGAQGAVMTVRASEQELHDWVRRLRQEKLSLEGQKSALQAKVDRLQGEVVSLRRAADDTASMRATIDKLRASNAALRQRADKFEADATAASLEVRDLRQRLRDRPDNAELRDRVQRLRDRADRFEAEAKAASVEVQDLRQRLRDRPDNADLRDQVQRLRDRADRFEAQVKERDTELADAREAVRNRNATIDDLKGRVAEMRDRIERLQKRAGVR